MKFLSTTSNRKFYFVVFATLIGSSIGASGSSNKHANRSSEGATQPMMTLSAEMKMAVTDGNPPAVRKAVEDLASDFEKVMGKRPKVVEMKIGAKTAEQMQDAGPVAIVVGEAAKLPEKLRPSGLSAAESFSISVHATSGAKMIVLAGADMRGTIYAVYEFSQKYLGIDPLYYWTDQAPAHRAAIEVPLSLDETYKPPVFRYRGFFINDEDLLTGWSPGEAKDKTGISLAVWDKIFETILRLKGNMIAPGTWIFPDDPQVKAAGERGLIVTQHHAIPLGLNVARWPKDVPYNYSEHPEILEQAWKDAVNAYQPNQEVVWSVGLRGLSDVTYASMDPSVKDNNKALGKLISKAIADQMRIVRAVRPDAKFVTNLWQEGARLVQQGDLTIPPEVMTVWADDGYGYLQDHGEVAAGQGAYDHVAMMNGRANQLTEMVPIERSMEEIGRYIKAGATQYYLVNTSDIRPVTMSIRAVMDAVWKGVPEGDAAGDFYKQWSEDEFGKKAAPQLEQLYDDYFKAPAHFGDPVHEYGDQLYHTEARRLMLTYMTDSPLYALPSQAPKWEPARILGEGFGPARFVGKEWMDEASKREIHQCGDAQARWDAVWKKALAIEPLVPAARLPFYREQVLAMIAINRESNRALLQISKAIQDAQAKNLATAQSDVKDALVALDAIDSAESAAEYGKWKNWYRGDWLTGVYRTREMTQEFAKFLDDPLTHVSPPVLWDGWEAYYHIMHYEGDRSADVK